MLFLKSLSWEWDGEGGIGEPLFLQLCLIFTNSERAGLGSFNQDLLTLESGLRDHQVQSF